MSGEISGDRDRHRERVSEATPKHHGVRYGDVNSLLEVEISGSTTPVSPAAETHKTSTVQRVSGKHVDSHGRETVIDTEPIRRRVGETRVKHRVTVVAVGVRGDRETTDSDPRLSGAVVAKLTAIIAHFQTTLIGNYGSFDG